MQYTCTLIIKFMSEINSEMSNIVLKHEHLIEFHIFYACKYICKLRNYGANLGLFVFNLFSI